MHLLSHNIPSRPAVSVCIPTFNSSLHIEKCIRSILNQSFQDFEILVSDNASHDNTVDIIRSLNDPRIRIYEQDHNIGPHRNFNFLISHASAPYIKTFCSDDLMAPRLIEKQTTVLNEHEYVGVVSCDALLVFDDGIKIHWQVEHGYRIGLEPIYKSISILQNLLGNPSSYMFRKDAVEGRDLDPRYQFLSDVALPGRILSAGWHFFGLDYVGFKYIRHNEADTHRARHYELNDWLQLMDEFQCPNFSSYIQILQRCSGDDMETRILDRLSEKQHEISVQHANDLLLLAHTPAGKAKALDIYRSHSLRSRLINRLRLYRRRLLDRLRS